MELATDCHQTMIQLVTQPDTLLAVKPTIHGVEKVQGDEPVVDSESDDESYILSWPSQEQAL